MMIKKTMVTLCCLLSVACAPFDSNSSLEQRVDQQDMRIRQLQPQQADTMNQIQAMRQEIESLRGQLDELNNAGGARAIADRVRQHDAALRQVDNNMSLNLDLGSPMPTGQATQTLPPVPTQGLPPHAPDSSAYGASSTVPAVAPAGNYGLPPDTPQTNPAAADTNYQTVAAPSESTWGQADPRPELQVPKKDISLALFDAGVNSYNARDYSAAERSFNDFLKNYPNHSQTPDAQYYLAECLFQRNRFPEAALAYDTVIKKYPKSSVTPGAYLKQAICFSKMNQAAAAKARMQEIISKFPNSPEAARAKTFLKTNK